jgi:2-polyprenyl-6-methoxyphenol hydroxylase-like FAD-dependent oxidoreductase
MGPVLVAGGGIGGLGAALCLHRAGHEVTVFETVSEPRELGVGINLLPHSVRVLHDLGLEAQDIPVAAGQVEHGLHPYLFPDLVGEGEVVSPKHG